MSTAVTTNKVRFSYVHVFAPHANAEGQEPKYSVSIIIDKRDTATLNRIRAAIEEAKMNGKASFTKPPRIASDTSSVRSCTSNLKRRCFMCTLTLS